MPSRQGVERIWTAPNVLSFGRLALIIAFVVLLFNVHNRFYAFTILGLAGVTDFLDGFIARRFNQVTKLGKLLDPIVDRVVLATGIIAIVAYGAVPIWLTVVVLVREVFLLIVATILRTKGVRGMEVLPIGKAGAFGLMFAFPTFLLGHGVGTSETVFRAIAWIMVIPSVILSWIAAVSYLPMAKKALSEQHAETLGSKRNAELSATFQPWGSRMKAVIMAGGEGTRLRPLTMSEPKPMLAMANKPMAEHVIALLKRHGFDEIVITVAYLANTIRTYFGDGSEFGVRIIYATEQTPLGTAGSVLNAREELDERFLVISGDVLTDIDLTELVRYHDERGAIATLALKSIENPLEFGIVITDDEGRIERFLEKPSWGQVFSDTINTGIYVLEPSIFDHIAPGGPVDFSSEVFPKLLEENVPLYGFISDEYWEDVGDLEAYLRAHEDVLDEKVSVAIEAFPLRPHVWVGSGTEIHPTAIIEEPVLIGDNCRVGEGAHVGPYAVLGANVRVGNNTRIEHTVVLDNCYLGAGVGARGSVIGHSCDLRQGVHLEEGVVIAADCRIGHNASISAGVRIYPHKIVDADAMVTTSIIWESRASQSLFSRLGIAGLANVDLSPELAVRAAVAYATTLPKGASVTTSRDSSRAARMLKRAVMVGLNAAGLNVEDLETATLPMTRFHVRTSPSQGGISVRLAREDPESVLIRFLDAEGVDVDEATQRKIERLYYREDVRRVLASEIGDIDFPSRTGELYTAALTASVDLEAIRRSRFKLVLDYAFGTASLVMPNVLSKLGAEVLVVNPLISTPGVISFDREVHTTRLAELVRASGAHLGVVIGPDGEQLSVIDDQGKVLSDGESLLAFTVLVDTRPHAKIAVPVSATWRVNEVCAERNAEVTWSQLGNANLMEVARTSGAQFGSDGHGGFVFPEFLPGFDAIAALVHLLDLLAKRSVTLSQITSNLPPVCVLHVTVPTRFDQKGAVMRGMSERAKADEVIYLDGVKTVDASGWTLVVPDQDEPITHVYVESDTPEASQERADRAVTEIIEILQET